VCEGEKTERNYFDQLKREGCVAAKFAVTVAKGTGGHPEAVVQRAVELKETNEQRGEDFDEVWCVLDVETSEKRKSLDRAAGLAERNSITLCLSNPCFEVWLIAHLDDTARSFADGRAAETHLNGLWKRQFDSEYRKNDEDLYRRLGPLARDAVSNARRVREQHHGAQRPTSECNSSTDVYRLVAHLLGDT